MLCGSLQNNTEQSFDILEMSHHDKNTHIFIATIPAHERSQYGCLKIWCIKNCFKLYLLDHLTHTLYHIYVDMCNHQMLPDVIC